MNEQTKKISTKNTHTNTGTTACACLGFRYGSTCAIPCPGYQVINQAQNEWVVCNGKGTCDSGSSATGRCR